MGKLPSFIEKRLIGKIWQQPFYENLHRISLRGMNYMQSQSIEVSGERFAMQYANSKRKGKVVLFDVGANVGDYSEVLSREFKHDFKIHAFEPSKKLFQSLQTKFRTDPNIAIHGIGFSDANKILTLYNAGDLYGTVYPTHQNETQSENIELETIDGFCIKNEIDSIYYLKIDVEGAEMDVLKGAKQMIDSNAIQFIQFEFGPKCFRSKNFSQRFFLNIGQLSNLQNLKRRTSTFTSVS